MDTTDRRKYQRVETSNLISYESIDKDGEIIFNSMGKAVNVSQAVELIASIARNCIYFIISRKQQ